eukprot:2223196-Prymnesium_polylepis.1
MVRPHVAKCAATGLEGWQGEGGSHGVATQSGRTDGRAFSAARRLGGCGRGGERGRRRPFRARCGGASLRCSPG